MEEYTEQITLDEGDVDYRGLMKPSALLRCAEHMATAHAASLGMDKAFYAARHLVYLVGRQAFRFERVPAMRETLTLTTCPEQARRRRRDRPGGHPLDAGGYRQLLHRPPCPRGDRQPLEPRGPL